MIKRESSFKAIQWGKPGKGKMMLAGVAPEAGLRQALAKFGAPSPPGKTAKDKTINLLKAAAEIEHQLLVEYLNATYSLALTPPPGSGVAPANLAQWRGTIVGVAKEEMGHLITVQNLLLFLGAPPYLGRISPASEGHAPFPFKLERLSLLSLAKYICAESPDRTTLDAPTLQRAQPAYDLAKKNNIDVTPVGLVYAQLYFLFQQSSAQQGPWNVSGLPFGNDHLDDTDFVPASADFQGSSDDWNTSSSLPTDAKGIFVSQIRSRQDALQALHDISAQGEGLSGSNPLSSHFMRFLEIFQNIPRDPANAGQILPGLIRPFPVDPVYGPGSVASPPESRITDPISAQWCELLDLQYHLLLSEIALSLTLDPNMAAGVRGNVLTTFAVLTEMVGNVKEIATMLATLPQTPEVPVATASAAPTFSEIDFPLAPDPPNLAVMRRNLALWARELVGASNMHVKGMLANGIQANRAPVFPTGHNSSNQDLDDGVLKPVLALP